MGLFSLFCTSGRAEEIVTALQDMGFYVTTEETIQGRTRFVVDAAPHDGESAEHTELRVYRGIVSVLEGWASDR